MKSSRCPSLEQSGSQSGPVTDRTGSDQMELFQEYEFRLSREEVAVHHRVADPDGGGLISLAMQGGPRYGIEFKGGMLMTVKFEGPPPIEKIRSALDKALPNPLRRVQTFRSGFERSVDRDRRRGQEALTKNRQIVLDTLAKTFGQPDNGKLDLNNASAGKLAATVCAIRCSEAGAVMSDPQVEQLATDIMTLRDDSPRSGC